jgi:hypothetical protein
MAGPVIRASPLGTRAARPYLARQSREVEAVSGWRLGTQRDNGGLGEPRPTTPPPETVLSPLAPISPCQHVPSRLRRAHLCTASSTPWPTGQLINGSTHFAAPILNTPYSILSHPPLHFCTGAPLRFAPLHGLYASLSVQPSLRASGPLVIAPLAHMSPCQRGPSRKRMPTCHHASLPACAPSGQPAN